jgi:hypothetical protein
MRKHRFLQYEIIDNHLNNINNKLSLNEKQHLKELKYIYRDKAVSTLIKIIVEVEENRVSLFQDLGYFTLELINLLPVQNRVQFYKFAKRQRILILNKKLHKTFESFMKQIK